ncbi:hypothetical protein BC830DRAFT_760521 [Chytriomyces sp. MP71]|nr:hypothetical protein BC830DRAFT_760521 [Chytriomyces sp. MP71]
MEPTDCGCRDPAETSSLIVAAPASAAAGVVGRLVLDTSTVAVVDDANWSASFEGAENCVVLVLFALAYATLALRRSVAASWRRRREGFGGGAKPGVEAVPFEAEASERTKKSLKQARSARIHADNVRRRSSALLSNNEADVDSDFSLEPVRKKAASPASPAAPVPAATDLPARHTAPRSHSNAKKNNRAALHNNKSRHRCHLQSYQSAGDAGENSHSDADASPTTPMLNQIDAVLDSVPAARIARATDSNHCVLLYDPANGSNHESDHLQPTRTAVQFQDGQTGSNTSIPLSSNTVVIQKDHTPSSAPAIVDPTFEFPKRNFSAASNTNTFNDSLMFSSGFRPPTITTMRDSSLTDSSTHCPTRMSSSTPVGAGANGNNSGHTDTDSKSNLSNSVKTIMTFEHSVKLKDGDDGGSENSADRPSGLGSFWRRGFSRPPSIHETPESSAAASSPSGSGLLPKLNLFGKRKSQADVVAIAGSAAAEALLSPVSPTVAGIMKGFFLGGKKSPAADGEFDAVLMPPPAGLDGAAESETRAPVPILKLPKNKKERNGKGNPPVSSSSSGVRATPASNEKGDKANGDKKSVASSSEGSSRFWSSSSKSKRRGAGEPIVVPLRDYLSSDAGGSASR